MGEAGVSDSMITEHVGDRSISVTSSGVCMVDTSASGTSTAAILVRRT